MAKRKRKLERAKRSSLPHREHIMANDPIMEIVPDMRGIHNATIFVSAKLVLIFFYLPRLLASLLNQSRIISLWCGERVVLAKRLLFLRRTTRTQCPKWCKVVPIRFLCPHGEMWAHINVSLELYRDNGTIPLVPVTWYVINTWCFQKVLNFPPSRIRTQNATILLWNIRKK